MKKHQKNKPLLITLIAVFVLIVLILLTSKSRTATFFENAFGAVLKPIQSFASTTSSSIVTFFQEMFNTTDADKENAKLKAKLAELEVETAELSELKKENERLKKMLGYAETLDNSKIVTAGVIAKSGSIWFDTFTINAGRNSGITTGSAVITGDGLAGIVTEVGATWAKVRSIIDAASSVGVLNERTRDNGFVRGILQSGSEGNLLELYFLPSGSDLVPGDIIITNGLGTEKIPKGLNVGTVKEVMRVSGIGTNEANAIITPSVDFLHLEEVMIILGSGDN